MTGAPIAACPSCGVGLDPGDRFCEACGRDIQPEEPGRPMGAEPAACRVCGADSSPDPVGYCGVCGTKLPAPGDRLEALDRNVAAVTDRGRRRPRNEDAFAVSTTSAGRVLAVVCDGVSTTTSSDQASRQATEAALTALCREADQRTSGDALAAAFAAAREAVNGVAWASQDGGGPPSCTYLAVIASGDEIELSSMGDCRAFWLPDQGQPERLTLDDSWASDQIAAGTLTSDAAHADPRSHSITRWLGQDADPSWGPRRASLKTAGPGRLVLCSDGLWNYAGSAAAVADLAPPGDPLSVARGLVDAANGHGGHDNITVVVIDVPCCPTSPEPSRRKGSRP